MTAGDRFKALLQYPLPQHGISRLVHRLTRLKSPRALVQFAIRRFIAAFGVDMSQAAEPDPRAYASFNAFFTRPLKPQMRPIDPDPDAIVSPVDGTVSQAGRIDQGRIFQAKGRAFTAAELLGDARRAERYQAGHFATLYLSPRDYHRIHMPVAAGLRSMSLVPGRLFSVNPATTRAVPRLFARNERVVCHFTSCRTALELVLVGALNVGSMETVWAGEVTPPRGKRFSHWKYNEEPRLEKGAEMGRFNMGSTVILLFPAGVMEWEPALQAGSQVCMGQRIGFFK